MSMIQLHSLWSFALFVLTLRLCKPIVATNGSLRTSSSIRRGLMMRASSSSSVSSPKMAKPTSSSAAATSSTTISSTTTTPRLHGTTAHLIQQRHLLENQMHFVPLTCNKDLEQAACVPWVDKFGVAVTFEERVIVPCGECVVLQEGNFEFRDGIDIQGKLVIEPSSSTTTTTTTTTAVTVTSTMIAIQGELHMDASDRPVNGVPAIEFLLYNNGNEDEYFTAIDENAPLCTLEGEWCAAGKKSIAVAGGKIHVRGLPLGTPSWLPLLDVIVGDDNNDDTTTTTNTTDAAALTSNYITKLVLDASIQNKWAPGATLLITSHTHKYDDQQVARIVSIATFPADSTTKKVIVELDTPILRPTTQQDDERFAVEVALLSKNILWRGVTEIFPQDDTTADSELEGGHFWIMHTPAVEQVIEGVEIVNFGQQGNLGRYPLHFHLCGDVEGARVSKNTIRQSNQRCIVVHGTDNLLVEENIAFDTKGHCFMLEDGIEVGNHFFRNLGALTTEPAKIIPNEGTNGKESDMVRPSTYWITNPMNHFTGNVAAGSSSSGFWFDLRIRGPLKDLWTLDHPKELPLMSFKDNVAHSSKTGFRTYPDVGYRPKDKALFENLRIYRNQVGVFFRFSRNFRLEGGIFADNEFSLELDRADDMIIHGTEFIAMSDSYRSQVKSQGLGVFCDFGSKVRSWKKWYESNNTFWDSVIFTGYGEEFCENSIPFTFDGQTSSGVFNYFTQTKNITFVDSPNGYFDMCTLKLNVNVLDSYIIDLDGSLDPARAGGEAPLASTMQSISNEVSTLVGDASPALSFLGTDQCMHVPAYCYKYCEGVCFQTVSFHVDPAGSERHLKVCSKSISDTCVVLENDKYFQEELLYTDAKRLYTANLPFGEYTAVFLDQQGSETWPTFVHAWHEPHMCVVGGAEGYMEVKKPGISMTECTELIRNGMVQTDQPVAVDDPMWPWRYRVGFLELGVSQGIGGSNALKTNIYLKHKAEVSQYIDSRCISMAVGRTYEIKAWIKLVDSKGIHVVCDPAEGNCPTISLETQFIATTMKETDSDGYQLAAGPLTIEEAMIQTSGEYKFTVRSPRKDLYMYIDNVSMTLIDQKGIDADIKDEFVNAVDVEGEDNIEEVTDNDGIER